MSDNELIGVKKKELDNKDWERKEKWDITILLVSLDLWPSIP